MRKIMLTVLILVIFFSYSVTAQDVDSNEEVDVNRSITLVVEEKQPALAYALALLPVVGPRISACYVSQTPLEWKINEELEKKTRRQVIYNLAAILGGVAIDVTRMEVDNVLSVFSDDKEFEPLFSYLGVFVAAMHNTIFANDMAQITVNYNKALHEKFSWFYPQISISF